MHTSLSNKRWEQKCAVLRDYKSGTELKHQTTNMLSKLLNFLYLSYHQTLSKQQNIT